MKRIKKALIGLAVGTVAALGVVGFAACSDNTKTVEGEYSYENYGNTYGVKVEVTVENNKIKEVKTVETEGWTEATETESWDRTPYVNGKAALLDAYEGMSVDDVLAIEVTTDDKGQPTAVPEKDLLISTATQSCGRLLLAVQDALEKL